MDPFKVFLYCLWIALGLLFVLVVALLLRWAVGEPDCSANPQPVACVVRAP